MDSETTFLNSEFFPSVRLQNMVFRLAELLLNFSEEAEAVLADVICLAVRELDIGQLTIEESESFLLQKTIEEVRRIQAFHTQTEFSFRPLQVGQIQFDNAQERELSEVLMRNLSTLPNEYREVYVLHDILGVSAEDIPSIVSLSLQYARHFLHRARMMMWRSMQGNVRKDMDESSTNIPTSQVQERDKIDSRFL